MSEYKRCSAGIWDTTVPGIKFDHNGLSNYYHMFQKYANDYPRGVDGLKVWNKHAEEIKRSGKGKEYDCIIGVSGGTDSSFLLYVAKEFGLRPLAVTLDNGWSSEIAVKNIKKVTSQLKIDLETYVIDYEELKDILCSYIKAGLPWIDYPTDQAIKSILFRMARKFKVNYILIGHDFRSEGTQPNEWTYGDARQLRFIQKKFGNRKIKTFPNMSISENIYYQYFRGIKMLYPFFYIDYNKQAAREFLMKTFDWKYYGGHHHENSFTKFAIAYWMPVKFGFDKRIITFSAQICSGHLSRSEAIKELESPAYSPDNIEAEIDFVTKKLGITRDQFREYFNAPNHLFTDYPSYHPMFESIYKLIRPFMKYLFPQMPAYFLQIEERLKEEEAAE